MRTGMGDMPGSFIMLIRSNGDPIRRPGSRAPALAGGWGAQRMGDIMSDFEFWRFVFFIACVAAAAPGIIFIGLCLITGYWPTFNPGSPSMPPVDYAKKTRPKVAGTTNESMKEG